MTRKAALFLVVCLCLGLDSCASGGAPAGARRDPNEIAEAELRVDAVATLSAYDAIQRLRPGWLSPRAPTSVNSGTGTLPALLMNNAIDADLGRLRSIRVSEVSALRYVSGPDATTRYGTGYPNGLIEVLMRTGAR